MDEDGIFTIRLKSGTELKFRPIAIAIDEDQLLQGTDYLDNEGPTIQGYDLHGHWLRIPFCWLTTPDLYTLLHGIRLKSRDIRYTNSGKHPRDPLAAIRKPSEVVA